MGQHPSKANTSLTFGYINQNRQQEIDEDEIVRPELSHQHISDFVLDHPHLYQLEYACHSCSLTKYGIDQTTRIEEDCTHCRQYKRLSVVRRTLANDLSYIDTTYYPNIAHYISENSTLDEDGASSLLEQDSYGSASHSYSPSPNEMDDNENGDTDTLRDEQGWSRLTMSEFTPNTLQRLVSSPLLMMDLSGKSLIKLSSSIGYLSNLTKLNISDNQMINLPRAIGQLKNLKSLNAANNQLEYLPDTIATLPKLKAINISNNKLTVLPKGIGSLKNIVIILANNNQLTQLPRELASLENLITLNISHNPLSSIPAEISTLRSLRKLRAEGCPFETEFVHSLVHDPPSLFETCARQMIKNKISLPAYLNHFVDYFKRKQTCSFCCGPFFDSFVTRGKFIERANSQMIALDYQLCCAHWTDEQDRILNMFSAPSYRALHLDENRPESLPPMNENIRTEEVDSYSLSDPLEGRPNSSYHTMLSFATLHSRQAEEADQILQRNQRHSSSLSLQSIQKSSHLKQGFVHLGARLNIRSHRNRERSGTI
ncbi:Plant intracellular Ras-group-related LRR protein 9 [Choanephora cucurbitarum]|uniref:Plant intracellular Ras-group-related LRR protein 9 n=1 Tax=Choanephora cucurbitarum TaxID=101091 RepID=A0A1C7NQK1_9FUNG|nr:Plant intracellular Ras-group-related LRR protein 9 [Choanephora cucurbitarum]